MVNSKCLEYALTGEVNWNLIVTQLLLKKSFLYYKITRPGKTKVANANCSLENIQKITKKTLAIITK